MKNEEVATAITPNREYFRGYFSGCHCAAIGFVDDWLHLSIARASSALRSVCAAILHSSLTSSMAGFTSA